MEKPVIIAATSLDEHAYVPVARELATRNVPVVVYKTDKVLSGEARLAVTLSDNATLDMQYDGIAIAPQDIGAAWYRKVAAFRAGQETDDQAKQLHISSEIQALHDTLWSVYPDELWLNAPDRMRLANRKLTQLILAHELGFTIPSTTITNQWDVVWERLPEPLIAKTIRGIISEGEIVKAMYTTRLSPKQITSLESWTTPFPALYQPFIQKAREWRVTVVGDKVFPAAIYTDEIAKDDWRKHQLNPTVQFKQEQLPHGINERCIKFLGTLGLRFGAFDFIETHEGEFVFLECNPNGQYGWLEQRLGFPISQSIALELIRVAAHDN